MAPPRLFSLPPFAEGIHSWATPQVPIREDELFKSLQDEYNTVTISLQSTFAFHTDVRDAARRAENVEHFHKLMAETAAKRREETVRSVNGLLCSFAAPYIRALNVVGPGNEGYKALHNLLHHRSLDNVVMFLSRFYEQVHRRVEWERMPMWTWEEDRKAQEEAEGASSKAETKAEPHSKPEPQPEAGLESQRVPDQQTKSMPEPTNPQAASDSCPSQFGLAPEGDVDCRQATSDGAKASATQVPPQKHPETEQCTTEALSTHSSYQVSTDDHDGTLSQADAQAEAYWAMLDTDIDIFDIPDSEPPGTWDSQPNLVVDFDNEFSDEDDHYTINLDLPPRPDTKVVVDYMSEVCSTPPHSEASMGELDTNESMLDGGAGHKSEVSSARLHSPSPAPRDAGQPQTLRATSSSPASSPSTLDFTNTTTPAHPLPVSPRSRSCSSNERDSLRTKQAHENTRKRKRQEDETAQGSQTNWHVGLEASPDAALPRTPPSADDSDGHDSCEKRNGPNEPGEDSRGARKRRRTTDEFGQDGNGNELGEGNDTTTEKDGNGATGTWHTGC